MLTLGSYPWCSSNWQGVYYRLFPLGRDLEPAPIVNGSEYAYVGRHDPPIQGSATTDDLLVEFTVGSLDPGLTSREAIRHYKIKGGSAKRTDPLALSPSDFVDEWLTTDWKESASWCEPTNRSSMTAWRQRLKDAPTEFMFPTMHCLQRPDLWQVALDSSGTQSTQPKPTYFLVRWRPPYRFRMVSVGDKPWPGCTEKDAAADQDRTLFPVQDWR